MMKKLISVFCGSALFACLNGCETTGMSTLSTLGQMSPYTSPAEKALWGAVGTASKMEHEREIAQTSKTQINISQHPANQLSSDQNYYVVQLGDSLHYISKKTGVPVKKLIAQNPSITTDHRRLYVGQTLVIGPASRSDSAVNTFDTTSKRTSYTETLSEEHLQYCPTKDLLVELSRLTTLLSGYGKNHPDSSSREQRKTAIENELSNRKTEGRL